MSKRDKQPAKISYFFGQGYSDVGAFIKELWKKNAQTARKYYDKYNEKGLMSFGGIFRLFGAISVVTFGTVFFLIISAIMIGIFSVMFLLVYSVFLIVWIADRLYLSMRKVFTACTVCKGKFIIPIYLCPNCGARHTKLTPGRYGIFRRTCTCGQKLPCTAFGGRRKLSAICPECLKRGRITYLYDRESRPFCVPVVGGRSVGKTAYITAFSEQFIEKVAPENGLEIEFYSKEKEAIYDKIRTDYAHGSTRMTERANDPNDTSSVSFSFFVKHRRLHPERLLHIYDIAGEVFTNNTENEVQRQYEYCHGVVFVIDPFSIPRVRARYDDALLPRDRAGVGRADINGVINVFINKLREVTGFSDEELLKVPIAIVINKTDSAGLMEEFSEENKLRLRVEHPELSLDDFDAEDLLCRKFLKRNGMEGFISSIDVQFKLNRYFVASAIGHQRDDGEYKPKGVMEPMEWIAGIADRQFASLWSEHLIKERPEGMGRQ